MNPRNKLRILSIDGGGLRGVIPLQLIKYVEQLTGKPIHENFDLIAGASTGALLTCALTCGQGNQRLYSLEEIENFYLTDSNVIFPYYTGLTKHKISIKGWLRPTFTADNLNSVLTKYFGERRITSCIRPIFVVTHDIHQNTPIYFTSREAFDHRKNLKLIDICRASSAAPTYLPTFDFNYDYRQTYCIDGGVIMNNPSFGAIMEIIGNSNHELYKTSNEFIDFQNIHVLSLGTGSSLMRVNGSKTVKWGKLQWARPLIKIAMEGPANILDLHLQMIYLNYGIKDNYIRFNLPLRQGMDDFVDSREKVINYWITESNNYIQQNDSFKTKLKVFLRNADIELVNN